jgi:hypothetical protein
MHVLPAWNPAPAADGGGAVRPPGGARHNQAMIFSGCHG